MIAVHFVLFFLFVAASRAVSFTALACDKETGKITNAAPIYLALCNTCNKFGLGHSIRFLCDGDKTVEVFSDKSCRVPISTIQLTPFEDVFVSPCNSELLEGVPQRLVMIDTDSTVAVGSGEENIAKTAAVCLVVAQALAIFVIYVW